MAQKQIENDSQLDELANKVAEVNHASVISYSKVLKVYPGGTLRCRKVELVLQDHFLSQCKGSEGYEHHLLFIFYSFRDEFELKICTSAS